MADNRINFPVQPWIPLGNARQAETGGKSKATGTFAGILQQETASVKFSQHALERLQSRNLQLSSHDMAKLSQAVEKIAQKGARESLVYLNDVALVVSIKNKTVITAMDGSSAKENIFTNIDSAVIL